MLPALRLKDCGALHLNWLGLLTMNPDVYCCAGPGREVFILEDLKDANIVQFLGACFEEGSTMLVTGAVPSNMPCYA